MQNALFRPLDPQNRLVPSRFRPPVMIPPSVNSPASRAAILDSAVPLSLQDRIRLSGETPDTGITSLMKSRFGQIDHPGLPNQMGIQDPRLMPAVQAMPSVTDLRADPTMLGSVSSPQERLAHFMGMAAQAPTPEEVAQAKEGARLGGLVTQYDQMAGLTPPQQETMDLPPAPTRRFEELPERDSHPNTMARLFAGLAGLIAPQAAGTFGAAELGGEQKSSDEAYQDAMTRYNLATARDEREYQDAQNERNLFIQNKQRNAAINFQNQQGIFDFAKDQAGLTGEIAGSAGAYSALGPLAAREQKAAQAQAAADAIREQMKYATDQEKAQLTAEWHNAQNEANILRTMLMVQGQQANAQGRADMQQRSQDVNLIGRMGAMGNVPTGEVDSRGIPTFRPGTGSELSPKLTSDLKRNAAMAQAHVASADRAMADIKRINAEVQRINRGDATKSTPYQQRTRQAANTAAGLLKTAVTNLDSYTRSTRFDPAAAKEDPVYQQLLADKKTAQARFDTATTAADEANKAAPTSAPVRPQGGGGKTLTPEIAAQFLRQAGGNRQKAKAAAAAAGYR